jgi:hypothetical protein
MKIFTRPATASCPCLFLPYCARKQATTPTLAALLSLMTMRPSLYGRQLELNDFDAMYLVSMLRFIALLQVSRAQDATVSSRATGTVEIDAPTPIPSTQMTLSITQNTISSITSGSATSRPPNTYPGSMGSSEEPVHDASVFNYYFLFLVAFGVILAALLWWLHLRRKRRKQQLRLSGQQALARDLEGWGSARRFMHGRYGRYQASAQIRREEGLNENGEAPPPYYPKSDTGRDQESGLAIPLRTIPPGENTQVDLPGYTTRSNGL